jgi:hypothetical protein
MAYLCLGFGLNNFGAFAQAFSRGPFNGSGPRC